MINTLVEHSALLLMLLLAAVIFYFAVKLGSRAEQTRDKRTELMERVQRLKKKLEPDEDE